MIDISKINSKSYYCLLPEYYLRPFEPHFIISEQLNEEIDKIQKALNELAI